MMASAPDSARPPTPDDTAAIDELAALYRRFRAEIAKVIIGQETVVEQLATCLFANGHALLTGVPGLAKTLLVSSVARTFDLSFSRIQFTPDLMPSDITGTDVIQDSSTGGRREFQFMKGPVFTHILLADEINRAPAKTQSALLEAMQEKKVTVPGHTHPLVPPFFVLATQNPIEQEGTYPLPEAQLDRFMFLIEVGYPSAAEETRIARETTCGEPAPPEPLFDAAKIIAFQQLVRRVPVPEHVITQAVAMVRKTRPGESESPAWIKDSVTWGAGPRAVQYLILGAKSRAALRGSYMASLDDLEAVAPSVLAHRIITSFPAEARGITPQGIVRRLIGEMRNL